MTSKLGRENNVFGLEISVNDAFAMQVVNCLEDLCGVKRHIILYGFIHSFNLQLEIASLDILELKVKLFLILERTEYFNDKGTYLLRVPKLVIIVTSLILIKIFVQELLSTCR